MGSVIYKKGCGSCSGAVGCCEADAIRRIPVLRYLKDPVMDVNDLYKNYPTGGQPGWYAFVFNEHNFAYWHFGRNKWELLPAYFTTETFLNNLGFDIGDLVDNQILMWDEVNQKFKLYIIKTTTTVPVASDTPGLYLVVGKGVYVVEEGVVKEIIKSQTPSDATITIKQGGVVKGSFTLNQAANGEIELDAGGVTPTPPSDATITIKQGGVVKGSFTLNQAANGEVNIDAGGGDDFAGYTLNPSGMYFTGGPGTFLQIPLDIPSGIYNTSTGFFNDSSLMRVRFNINPLNTALPDPTGCVMSFRDGANSSFEWKLMDYFTNSQIIADALFFKREIFVRADTASKTLYWSNS